MSEWQPIETATTDKPILGYGLLQGEINGISAMPGFDIIHGKVDRTDHSNEPGWWTCITGDGYATWMKPTHWQPLPEPPDA